MIIIVPGEVNICIVLNRGYGPCGGGRRNVSPPTLHIEIM